MDSMNNVRSSEGCGTASSEEITGYSWKALLGSAIGYAMDGFDLLILGFMQVSRLLFGRHLRLATP